jgi:Icc-related predicted phosphoesterase
MLSFESIHIDPHTPTQSWNRLATQCIQKEGRLIQKQQGVRVVCISDTHCMHKEISLPHGDILVHTGDSTRGGSLEQLKDFLDWFSIQPFSYRIWIAGNHDLTLHSEFYEEHWKRFHRRGKEDIQAIRRLLKSYPDVIYLEDDLIELEELRIYGSPWQPTFFHWAFNKDRGQEIALKWKEIPQRVDILLTHGPPLGYGDLCNSGARAGCADLLHHIMYRIQPRLHVFGHIHEGEGIFHNEKTQFVNASSCDQQYRYCIPPKVITL